jgi:hypothetical protein
VIGRDAENNMSVYMASVSAEFDIFPENSVQEAVQETVDVTYKPIATIDQTDLKFYSPSDDETYIDTNLHIFVSGKLTTIDSRDLTAEDYTAVTNKFLLSLFILCTIYLNGVIITQS